MNGWQDNNKQRRKKMARTWSDFFDKGGSSSYDDYYIKPTHFLKNGTKRDGYVLKLENGVNWRFSAEFPDSEVRKAYAMAKEEFADMDVQRWDRNAKSNIANIRICKTDESPLAPSELDDLLLRIAALMIGWRNA
jgi:hypothetical protein